MFTGDRSGDWLYRALFRAGFANRPEAEARGDGLELTGLLVTAAVRCAPPANKPTPAERDACAPWLDAELDLLSRLRVIVVLGGFAYAQTLRLLKERGCAVPTPRPPFGHVRELGLGADLTLLMSYHPSQQNTFTGKLTEEMFDAVWERARDLVRR
jgi:uracil-DNA glycosylase family 4